MASTRSKAGGLAGVVSGSAGAENKSRRMAEELSSRKVLCAARISKWQIRSDMAEKCRRRSRACQQVAEHIRDPATETRRHRENLISASPVSVAKAAA